MNTQRKGQLVSTLVLVLIDWSPLSSWFLFLADYGHGEFITNMSHICLLLGNSPPPPPVRKKTGNKFLSANSSIPTPEPSARTIRPYYTATLIIRGAQVLLIMLIYSGDCVPSTSMETMHAPSVIRNPIILEEIESLCDALGLYCTAKAEECLIENVKKLPYTNYVLTLMLLFRCRMILLSNKSACQSIFYHICVVLIQVLHWCRSSASSKAKTIPCYPSPLRRNHFQAKLLALQQ